MPLHCIFIDAKWSLCVDQSVFFNVDIERARGGFPYKKESFNETVKLCCANTNLKRLKFCSWSKQNVKGTYITYNALI